MVNETQIKFGYGFGTWEAHFYKNVRINTFVGYERPLKMVLRAI